MILTGVIVNAVAIVVGGAVGLWIGKGIPAKVTQTVLSGLGLCVLWVGISGSLNGQNAVVIILSVAIGAAIGELLDIDARLLRLGDRLQARLAFGSTGSTGNTGSDGGTDGDTDSAGRPGAAGHSFAEGFVTCTLLFCVGAMAVVGSVQSGLTGDHQTLFTKAVIDGISSLMLGATLGVGVLFAAVPVLIYQGAISLSAHAVSGLLTGDVIKEVTCVGSLLIVGIGLNMLGITKLKVANFLLAPFVPLLFHLFM